MTTIAQPQTTCRVEDKIVHWDEIAEGDLVLFAGQMERVERIGECRAGLRVFICGMWLTLKRDAHVAVRRFPED